MTDERDIQIARGVYAIGICLVPDRLVPVMRTALDEMKGDDWVAVPYSLARAMSDTLAIHIRKKLPYLSQLGARGALIVLDEVKGELRLTDLGTASLKKMQDNIAKRG